MPHISKSSARLAIEALPEVKSRNFDASKSVAGYCNSSQSKSNGMVWAAISTPSGVVQYSGYADDMRKLRPVTSKELGKEISMKMSDGYQDIDSNSLEMRPWSSFGDSGYRGVCSSKKRKACKRSKRCTYRKRSSKNGKIVRRSSCAKKSRKSRRVKPRI